MKKYILLILVILSAGCLAGCRSREPKETPAECFEYYDLPDGTIKIIGYKDDLPKHVVMPKIIEGKPVSEIGPQAFSRCSQLIDIKLPDSITQIGFRAFAECSNLTEINLPSGVTVIKEQAFIECSSLTGIKIPDGVTDIEEYAFSKCTALADVEIPASVENIGLQAFYDTAWQNENVSKNKILVVNGILVLADATLTEISIPDTVTTVLPDAFGSCKSLTEIEIPDSVTNVGKSSFAGTPWYDKRLEENGFIIVNGTLAAVDDSITEFQIPDNVTAIGEYAFSSCDIADVTIPNSVKSIGFESFFNCKSLKNITLPEGVTTIDDRAFIYCDNLASVEIPSSVTHIGNSVFFGYNENPIIKTPAGSYAEQYAKEHELTVENY